MERTKAKPERHFWTRHDQLERGNPVERDGMRAGSMFLCWRDDNGRARVDVSHDRSWTRREHAHCFGGLNSYAAARADKLWNFLR